MACDDLTEIQGIIVIAPIRFTFNRYIIFKLKEFYVV